MLTDVALRPARPGARIGLGSVARRRARRGLRVAAAAVVVGGLAVAGLWVATPNVDSAPSRAARLLAAHGGTSLAGVVPARVEQTLVATEDSRFYGDHGLDWRGTAREVKGVVTQNDQGGANLDQQLAKLLWAPGSPLGGLETVALAVKLDAHFTKSRILAMYLDAAYFGDGAYGVQTAARHYFGLPADRLSWAQAAMIAGLVQAPSDYDPHGHLHLARSRQAHVLDRLVAVGTLTRPAADQAKVAALHPVVSFYG